jgi:hypothetical protein
VISVKLPQAAPVQTAVSNHVVAQADNERDTYTDEDGFERRKGPVDGRDRGESGFSLMSKPCCTKVYAPARRT